MPHFQPRFLKKKQNPEEHRENTKRCDAKDVLHTEIFVYPGSDQRPHKAADIYQRVVDGITDRAHIFVRGACSGPDHARFDERDAESRQH